MKEEPKKSIQLDDIMRMLEVLERRISRLENSFDVHRLAVDTMSDNVYSMYKTLMSVKADLIRLDDMESDLESDTTHIFHLMYGCGDFCGNCKHCVSCPDGLYRCDITECELDPDSASCIRFDSSRPPKSDAEICKACSDRDTPRCYKCSHFPF